MDGAAYERALRPLLIRAAAYARVLLRDRHDAEDAVQQAALRAWERIGRYDPARPFAGWWFAVLRNCCLDVQRARKSRREVDLADLEPGRHDPPRVLEWQALERALGALPKKHREILHLRYFADLSYVELAEALDIPRGTVMSRLHLARKALAALVGEEDP